MTQDPYTKYLKIPPGPRPPKPHQLLGIPKGTTDPAKIESATAKRLDELDQYALSNDHKVQERIQFLMNQVAQARSQLIAAIPKSKKPAPRQASIPHKDEGDKENLFPSARKRRTKKSSKKRNKQVVTFNQISPKLWGLIVATWAISVAISNTTTFFIANSNTPTPAQISTNPTTEEGDSSSGLADNRSPDSNSGNSNSSDSADNGSATVNTNQDEANEDPVSVLVNQPQDTEAISVDAKIYATGNNNIGVATKDGEFLSSNRQRLASANVALQSGDIIYLAIRDRYDINSAWVQANDTSGKVLFNTNLDWISYKPSDEKNYWLYTPEDGTEAPVKVAPDRQEYVNWVKEQASDTPSYTGSQPIRSEIKTAGYLAYAYYIVNKDDLRSSKHVSGESDEDVTRHENTDVKSKMMDGLDPNLVGYWKVDRPDSLKYYFAIFPDGTIYYENYPLSSVGLNGKLLQLAIENEIATISYPHWGNRAEHFKIEDGKIVIFHLGRGGRVYKQIYDTKVTKDIPDHIVEAANKLRKGQEANKPEPKSEPETKPETQP